MPHSIAKKSNKSNRRRYKMFNFIQLPNKLFYTTDESKSILQQINDDNLLLVIDYLYINTNKKDITLLTIQDLILSCGYNKVDNHKGRNVDQFKCILTKLKDVGIITTDIDFNTSKPTELLKIKLNLLKENEGFIQLLELEKDKILLQDKHKVDNKKLLIYYCYLKSRIYKRNNNDAMVAFGGRAEVTWVTYVTIGKDLGFTDESIKKYNDILLELNLIRIGYVGNWYYADDKNKVIRESVNISFSILYTKSQSGVM
jgi:hypothetical protein